jgi:hypothetical protein
MRVRTNSFSLRSSQPVPVRWASIVCALAQTFIYRRDPLRLSDMQWPCHLPPPTGIPSVCWFVTVSVWTVAVNALCVCGMAVPECNPQIDELDSLVDKLNATESLSNFTVAVRKAWCRQCRE